MSDDRPGCANHLHLAARRGDPEPTLVCSCEAGLIHMHDCPVMNGRECRLFEDGDGKVVEADAYEESHTRLMEIFLARPYLHRVRDLTPEGDAWVRRKEELAAHYSEELAEDTEGAELTPEQEEQYSEEKERLIDQRKRREEARAEREAKSREEKARERAKMGIKTVVERAQESVAARGNVSESIVDDVKLPASKKKRRRRRRSGGSESAPQKQSPAPAEGSEKPRRRRRRRRRRGPPKQGGDSA
ncbi:MAG: hypothetical protein ACYTHK_08190 [Planctomycetota bacterium]|jgi:hypothetical protein